MPKLKRLPEEAPSDEEIEVEQADFTGMDFLRGGFGKQDTTRDLNELLENARRVPLKPKSPQKAASDSDSDDDDDDSDEDDDEYPISHWVNLKPHSKAVSSISLDPSGTRFVTASHDYQMKLFDFPAMSLDHKFAFRANEPSESHHVHSATFSHLDSGQSILVIPAANQAKIYSRDGFEELEFVKGDMYLRDMHNTKGHVAEITAGCWSPVDGNVVATASADSTIRLWDINNKRAHKEIMVHKSKTGKGGRSRMCSLAWAGTPEQGKSLVASVVLDGSLVVYAGQGPYSRPAMEVRDAHTPDTWTGGLVFAPDGRLLVSRGQDGCIKLWDTRKLKTPITVRTDFPTPPQLEANLIFTQSSSNILTGDSEGNLHILSSATLRTEETHAISPGAALTSLVWQPKINQILAGDSLGNVHILFSATKSTKGAITILSNAPRKKHIDDDVSQIMDTTNIPQDAILDPGEQPKKRMASNSERMKPAMPHLTPWGKSQPDQEYVRKTHTLDGVRDEDPREALLKYAEKAEKDPMFTGVWQKNQPKAIYADIEDEEEVADEKERVKRRKV